MNIAKSIAAPNLLGIDCRIAYADMKFHSGQVCTGVTTGFVHLH